MVGTLITAQGVWAFLAPRSFYDTLATFEPYNAHFLRDIGTIQIGLGVAGVVGALRSRGVVAGLAGLSAFQVLHVVSHVIDRHHGGHPGFDIPALAVFALATVVAFATVVREPDPVDVPDRGTA